MLTRKTLLASSLAMILTGCGGPNNLSGPAPVDNTPLPPVSDFISFSIAGQVVGPVNSTDLILYYGGTAVSVSVDANGYYIADVSLLRTEDNYVVYAVATDSQNDEINLVSIVGSVVELDAAAGADDMLTFDEALGVNVSGLSTALTALMEAANDGAVIMDKPMFDKAQKNYDSALLRPYANAIGLVTDNAGAVDYLNLPEGFADTWALVNDAQAVQDYLNTVRQNDSQLYWTTDTALLENTELASLTPSGGSLAGTYYFSTSSQRLDEGRMTLSEDGTGQWISNRLDVPFNWLMGDNGLELNFKPGGELIMTGIDDEGTVEEVRWTHSTMKWLNDTSVAAQLVSTNNYDVVSLNDDSQNYSQTIQRDLKAVKEVGVVDADNLFELGKTYVISLPFRSSFPFLDLNSVIYGQSVELVLSSGLATLTVANVDEQGLRIDESFEVSWRVDNNGHLILGHDTTQGVFDLAVLSENGGTTPFVNVQFNTQINGALKHYVKPGIALLKDEDLSWDSASLPGIYRVDSPDNNTLNTQWVEFNEDGSSLWVQVRDFNENGRVEFEQGELWLIAGRWQLGDDGDLIVRRYAEKVSDSYYYCASDEFEPAIDSTCQVFQQQNWSLYQQKGASSYLSEMRRMYLQEDNQPKIGLAQMKNQRLDKMAQWPVDITDALAFIDP